MLDRRNSVILETFSGEEFVSLLLRVVSVDEVEDMTDEDSEFSAEKEGEVTDM